MISYSGSGVNVMIDQAHGLASIGLLNPKCLQCRPLPAAIFLSEERAQLGHRISVYRLIAFLGRYSGAEIV